MILGATVILSCPGDAVALFILRSVVATGRDTEEHGGDRGD